LSFFFFIVVDAADDDDDDDADNDDASPGVAIVASVGGSPVERIVTTYF
jgi:hypothetical protein